MPVSKKPRKKSGKPKDLGPQSKQQGGFETCLEMMDMLGCDSAAFYAFFMLNKRTLMADESVSVGLIALIGQEDSDENTDLLLGRLLDEARMDIENDGRYGAGFVDAVEMAIETRLAAETLTAQNIVTIGAHFQLASLPVPEILKAGRVSLNPPEGVENINPDAQLAVLVQEILDDGGNAYDLFNALSEMSETLPAQVLAGFTSHIASLEGPLFEKCALYFLLSGDADIRVAVVSGLYERFEQSGLSAETMMFLPIIRGWLPSEPARDGIDELNKRVRRQSQAAQIKPDHPADIFEMSASIIDGAGAQSIAIGVERDGKYYVAMILTKYGHGVKDAFVVPCASQEEALSHMLRMQIEASGALVAHGTLRMLLEGALADGMDNGKIPAAGMVDVMETCDLLELRPQVTELPKLLDFLDPEKIIQKATPQALGRWINDNMALDILETLTDSWFEDTNETRQAIAKGGTATVVEKRIWKFLEGRRDLWARRFLQTAAMCRDSEQLREWKTLTASAHGLMNARPLKRIPLMEDIVYVTIAAEDPRMALW